MAELDDGNCRRMLKELTLKAQKEFKTRKVENDFLAKIIKRLSEVNFDQKVFELIHQQAEILKNVIKRNEEENNFDDFKFNSLDECMSFCFAKFFFEKLNVISNEAYPKTISYTDPIAALPIEVFSKHDSETKSHFENNLKRADVLYAEMVNPNVKEHDRELSELRIIGKVNLHDGTQSTQIVYPLNIHVFMFKNIELTRLGVKELSLKEILTVIYMNAIKSPGSMKHYITTNSNMLGSVPQEIKKSLNLGIISAKDLPFDFELVKISSQYPSYAHFLRHHPHFNHSYNLKELIQSIGIDPCRIYSFSMKRDGLAFPSHSSIEKLSSNAKLDLQESSRKHLEIAKTCIEKSNYANAEAAIEAALKCWPKNYKAFEIRGQLYKKQSKFKKRSLLKKAMYDFETSLQLNPSDQIALKELSNIYVYLANRNKGRCEKAKKYARRALELNSENKEAIEFLRRIDRRIAKNITIQQKADAMDLDSLEKHKKELEMYLKKELE